MPGFPNRITRSSLGPSYQNAAKLGNPKQEADASVFNLLCWQAAGMNLVVPKGIVVGLDDGNGNLSVVQQGFVWDPDQQLAPIKQAISPGKTLRLMPFSALIPPYATLTS